MIPKLLHVVYSLIRGGTEGQCARLALALSSQGYPSRVVVFRREGFFLDPVERACGPVYEVGIRRMVSRKTVGEIQSLKKWIEEWEIELVHCWDADAAIFGSVAARWAGVPYITSRRDLGDIYPRYKLWLMHRADLAARRVTVNADVIRRGIEKEGVPVGRITTVPNLLDVAEFDCLASQPFSQKALLPAGRWLVVVARLDREKDVGTAIKALSMLSSKYPDVYLVIAGDGPEKKALVDLSTSLKMERRVIFLGEVHEVPALLKEMEVALLTSSSNEGLSNSILEYMAAGLPVAATDCGGNGELVKEGVTGCLVKPGDAAGLAEAVAKLLDGREQSREMGLKGRQVVEKRHAMDRVIEKWMHVYNKAMGCTA